MQINKENQEKSSIKLTVEFTYEEFLPFIEKASKKILVENDANKNRRLDKKEIEVLREKIGNFLEYSLKIADEEPAEVAKNENKKPVKEKLSVHNIYD